MNKIAKFIFICLVFSNVNAQEKIWTLEECIQTGLQNSLTIKIKQIEVKRTQKQHNSIANNLLPNISFNANQSYNFGSTIDPSTNGRVSSNIQFDNFFLGARMNLIDFNAIATSQLAKIDIERAKLEKEVLENEYKLQIGDSFFTTLFTQELLKIQVNQLVNSNINLERIENEVNIGSKPKSDLYDIQLSFALDEKNILETKQLLEIQKTQLFQLLNMEVVNIEENVLFFNVNVLNQELTIDISSPKIKLTTLNYESDLKRIKQAKGNNLPILSAFYNYSTFYYKPLNQPNINVNSFSNQFSDNQNQQVGLQVTIPLFNGFRNSKNTKTLQFQSEISKLEIEQETLEVNQQIVLEENKIKQLKILESKLIEIQHLSEKTFVTSQSKFEVGQMEAIVFTTVKNQMMTSNFNVLKNKLQQQFAIVKLNLIKNNQL